MGNKKEHVAELSVLEEPAASSWAAEETMGTGPTGPMAPQMHRVQLKRTRSGSYSQNGFHNHGLWLKCTE